MKLSTQMVVVLTSIGLLSGGLLVSVGHLTQDRIALNMQRDIEEAILKVLPGTKSSQKLYEEKDFSVFEGKKEDGNLVGFAIHASGLGFQDRITFMLGVNETLTKLIHLVILDQKETPGLGAKITDEDSFLKFWENKDCSNPLTLRKPAARAAEDLAPYEVNTITGATISSKAVLDIANISLERVRQLIKEGKLKGGGQNGG
jgi:electron transport complex protein RnfG